MLRRGRNRTFCGHSRVSGKFKHPTLLLAAFVPERLDQQFHAILRVPEGGPSAISNTPWSRLNAIKRNRCSGHFETFYLHSEHLIMLKHWFNHHIKFLSNKSWFDALILTILNAFNQISVNEKNSCTRSVSRSAHKNFRKSLNSLAISNINANIILFIVL